MMKARPPIVAAPSSYDVENESAGSQAAVSHRSVAALIRSKPLVCYFVLAYAWAWACWIPLAITHHTVRVGALPTHFPGLLGPLVASFVVTAVVYGRRGLSDLVARMVRWRVGIGWYLVALSPIAFFAAGACLGRVTGDGWPHLADLSKFNGLPAFGVVGVWLSLVLINGYGEETGWRGFALPQLQRTRREFGASLILALWWALWHLPLFFIVESYRGLGRAAFPGFFFGLCCGSLVLAWLYNRTGGAILMVAIWHGTYNLAAGTAAAQGRTAAIVSVFVMIQALAIVAVDIRNRHRPSTPVQGEQYASCRAGSGGIG
jgi:membrane protease YdiL (CAAX protease family)